MNKYKAAKLALKIISTCVKYGEQDRCLQCPFNFNGCIVTDGNNVPSDWRLVDAISDMKMSIYKGGNK